MMKSPKNLFSFFISLLVVGSACLIKPVFAVESPMMIDSVSFRDSGEPLPTLTTVNQEVYKPDDSKSLELSISGEVASTQAQKLSYFAVILPTLQQLPLSLDVNSTGQFTSTITIDGLPYDKPIQMLMFSKSSEGTSDADPSVIDFTLKNNKSYPSFIGIFWQISRSSSALICIFVLFVLALFTSWKAYHRLGNSARFPIVSLTVLLFALLVYQSTSQILIQMTMRGLIQVPGTMLSLQRKYPDQGTSMALTKLDDNLELQPSLSSSWSNISPKIWEFSLRRSSPLPMADIVKTLNQAYSGSGNVYLNSVESIVSIDEDQLQFITKFPDPLLPQKLTKVNLAEATVGNQTPNISNEYLVKIAEPGSTKSIRNSNYIGLPFLSATPIYQNEFITSNLESLKKTIGTDEIELFDEPEPALWPTLAQHGYQIQPKINTKSSLVLFNRKSSVLMNPTLLAALKKIMNNSGILQTSYFQYGRLANQFAPPGVIGYDAMLQVPVEQRSITALIEQSKKELGVESIQLKFSFPDQEKVLASVLSKELGNAGIQVISTTDVPDLSLMTVDFDLGDLGPFLDGMIDSHSPLNHFYKNDQVDQLIAQSRSELNSFNRLKLLQQIMKIIVVDDPAGIPLLFKRSFIAVKKPVELSWYQNWLKNLVNVPSNTIQPLGTQME